jgi:genome maintenance exonuclease 1
MFHSIKPFIDSHLNNIAGIEIPLWSKQLGIAGRCDCVGDWKGEKAILDWKTSGKPKKKEWVEDYFLQATAYSIMFEERTEIPINNIVIVMAVENEEPQVFEEKTPDYWKLLETTLKEWK